MAVQRADEYIEANVLQVRVWMIWVYARQCLHYLRAGSLVYLQGMQVEVETRTLAEVEEILQIIK